MRNGAYEDDFSRDAPVVFIAGPIKHWWTCWGSSQHRDYVEWRERVREALVEAGYLTYAPWEAFKGTWNKRAQTINDAALAAADVVLVLWVQGVRADGTEAETAYARRVGVPILSASLGKGGAYEPDLCVSMVRAVVGPGVQP